MASVKTPFSSIDFAIFTPREEGQIGLKGSWQRESERGRGFHFHRRSNTLKEFHVSETFSTFPQALTYL